MKERPTTPETLAFGLLVKKLRLSHGLLLWEAAGRMGATPAWLSSLEHGRQELTPEVLQLVSTWAETLPNLAAHLMWRDR